MIALFALALVACVTGLAVWYFWPEPIRPAAPAVKPIEDDTDWFVWESEQIQRNGYVFWFDHWRYEGQPGAYPDPTPEQRRKVFNKSAAKAIAEMGQERVEHIVGQAVHKLVASGLTEQAAYERVRLMGQDPVDWAIKFTLEK